MSQSTWDSLILISNVILQHPAPYATSVGTNYLDLFNNSQRAVKRRSHATNHCFFMAQHFAANGNIPFACDWLVAAGEISENGETDRLLKFFAEAGEVNADTWPALFHDPPSNFGARLLSITLLRLILSTASELNRVVENAFLAFIQKTLPDVCRSLGAKGDESSAEQKQALVRMNDRISEILHPIQEAVALKDNASIISRFHSIQRGLTQNLVKAITSPYLPPDFVGTTLPAATAPG